MNRPQLLRAATICALALAAKSSHAQPLPAQPLAANAVEASAIKTVEIGVRNIPVSLMAYWLDPARQIAPIQIQQSRGNNISFVARELDRLPRQAGNGNGPRDLKLPAGIESIVAIDPQSAMLVTGTAAGIEEMKKLVAELDVPINQVEIEAQFVQMSPQILKALPLKFIESEGGWNAPSMAAVPPKTNFSLELNKLIAANQIRVITAPRVTAIDGLTAQLTSLETRSLLLSPSKEKVRDMSETDRDWFPGLATVQLETGITCTPIFRGDTIKLFLRSTLNDRSANVTANMRDGETIAIAMAPDDKSGKNTRTVIFVTTRIVRRASDDANVLSDGETKLGLIR